MHGWADGAIGLLREQWDANLRAFVDAYDKPLVIIGDLNVAHEDADLTHPSYFKVHTTMMIYTCLYVDQCIVIFQVE